MRSPGPRVPCCAICNHLLDAPTALAACCGFDLCYKYIWYFVWGICACVGAGTHAARRAPATSRSDVGGGGGGGGSPRETGMPAVRLSHGSEQTEALLPSVDYSRRPRPSRLVECGRVCVCVSSWGQARLRPLPALNILWRRAPGGARLVAFCAWRPSSAG